MSDTREKYIHKKTKLIMNRAMPLTKRVQQQPISTGRLRLQKKESLQIKK